jgi:hypothetical protein
LGPEGIIRFTFQIEDDWWEDNTSDYMQNKVLEDEKIASDAYVVWMKKIGADPKNISKSLNRRGKKIVGK